MKSILRHYVFGEKIHQNCVKIYATHQYDNDLLLRQETQKYIACPGSWYNNDLKKTLICCLELKGCIFYKTRSKWLPLLLFQW